MPPGILVFTLNQGVHAQAGMLHLQSPKLATSHLSQGAEHVFVKDNKSSCRYSSTELSKAI